VFSDRVVNHEIELAFLHSNCRLLAEIAFICPRVLILLLGLVLLRDFLTCC
jgi:hypothetical protein